ncbi:SRPBCC domain-containing protein [Kribbella antibiotica]|uniref:SRPBCC domain-containing protein n=1 Tax=Kribbella antibiotica TaxID=190195 RepID=A0A4R4ZM71_9ACTN|nr:SRPBCC domain-containing protein [Kribbella antibiotica]TDD59893.1 SRPBCC domain-containing protein [Kribbella antibiotica]
MVDILHRIGVLASVDDVYKSLDTIDGLAAWWTEDTHATDGVIKFRFGAAGGFDMKVLDSIPGELVRWEVVDGPAEWIGTHVRFDLTQEDDYAIVMFRHEGWQEQVPFMYHCSTKWATFLMSLKKLVETGTGDPAPNDVQVSNWH